MSLHSKPGRTGRSVASGVTQSASRLSDAVALERWYRRNRDALTALPSGGPLPRLLVDVSVIARNDAQTGIQRVVRAVWSELSRRSGGSFEVHPVHAGRSHGYCYAQSDFLERKDDLPLMPVSVRPGDKFLGLDLAANILPKQERQLRLWQSQGATIHLIVYDLLPLLRPDWFSPKMVAHFSKWLALLSNGADQAICISDQVARDLHERLAQTGTRKPSIARMALGADMAASVPSKGISADVSALLARLRFRPAVLMVGTVEPRKGYDRALSAFEHLWRRGEGPELVIVGKPGWKTAGLQARIRSHPEIGRRLHWFDQVSDEELCLLYDSCRALLMTSRAEGFGLPLIEAAVHQRYVLARDLAVFREHRLPNAIFFGDDAPDSLASQITELVAIAQKTRPARPDLPTWSQCVDGLLGVMSLGASPRHSEPSVQNRS